MPASPPPAPKLYPEIDQEDQNIDHSYDHVSGDDSKSKQFSPDGTKKRRERSSRHDSSEQKTPNYIGESASSLNTGVGPPEKDSKPLLSYRILIASLWRYCAENKRFIFGIAATVLLIFMGCYWLLSSRHLTTTKPTTISEQQKRWTAYVRELSQRSMFSGVDSSAWRVARAALARLLQPDNSRPATLALVTSSGEGRPLDHDPHSVQLTHCLAQLLATGILNVTAEDQRLRLSPLPINAEDISGLSDEEAKRQVESLVGERLRKEPADALVIVIVYSVQRLQPLTAMLFQGFCDNTAAPRRSALFVFEARAAGRKGVQELKEAQKLLEDVLWQSWGAELGESKFDALFSRIGGNAAVLDSTLSPSYDSVCQL